jgi:hypothetical protein
MPSQIVEAGGLIQLTDLRYYLPTSSGWYVKFPGYTFYATCILEFTSERFGSNSGNIYNLCNCRHVPMAEFQAYLDSSRSCPARLSRDREPKITPGLLNVRCERERGLGLYLHNRTYLTFGTGKRATGMTHFPSPL